MDPRDHCLGYLRDRLLILLFWLIFHIYLIRCIALTPFASVSFSQRYISRVLILLETISFVYIFSFSRSHAFQWFPTGLSFYFTLFGHSRVQRYLLTINKTRGYYIYLIAPFNIYPSFIFVDLPGTMFVVSLGNFVRCKFRHLHIFLLISSIKVSSWSDFSTLLRFLSEIILRCSIYFFVLTNFILTKHPLILFCTYQGSFSIHSHPLILSSWASIFYFSHSSRLFSTLLSYLSPFKVGLYIGAFRHRLHRFFRIFPICLKSFSFLAVNGFSIGFLFPVAFLFDRARFTSSRQRSKCSSVLIFSGLFCFLYLPALLQPRFIRKHTPSLLSHFLKFLSFDLRFCERKVTVFFSPSIISGCVTFHSLFPITLVLIHLS